MSPNSQSFQYLKQQSFQNRSKVQRKFKGPASYRNGSDQDSINTYGKSTYAQNSGNCSLPVLQSDLEKSATKTSKNFLEVPTDKNSRASTRKNSSESDDQSDSLTQASDNDQEQMIKTQREELTKTAIRQHAKQEQGSDESYEMATVKKPKKHFNSDHERENFVRQYQMKFKTEMCRNWELTGKCKFQNTCSFAHGKHELQRKSHLPQNFKTKSCTQFHETGFCPYGNRCQFLHSQYDIYNSSGLDYKSILEENSRLSEERANSLKEGKDLLTYVNVFQTRRLNCFAKIISNIQ